MSLDWSAIDVLHLTSTSPASSQSRACPTLSSSVKHGPYLAKMNNEELRIKDHMLFDLSECSNKFGRLRPSKDNTKQTCSPRLADIGKSQDFHDLIYLCSEHSPSVLKPVLQYALSKCVENEERIQSLGASKKRAAEIPIGLENHKHARLPHAPRHASLFLRKDPVINATPAITKRHNCNSISESNGMSSNSVSDDSEGLVEESDSDQGRDSAPQPSQQTSQTATAASTVTSTYEIELGLVRGEVEILKLVMDKCMTLSSSYRANGMFDRKVELQVLFDICRKLPLRIVKASLLRELRDRIEVPGTRTEIPLTGNMTNSSDILDALQCIKGTTINAKIHRAYGQMKLFRSVQNDIKNDNVPADNQEKSVSAHRVILEDVASRAAGKVSQKERTERKNFFNDEYNAGRKWVDVCEWFNGPGIVLIYVTAGVSD